MNDKTIRVLALDWDLTVTDIHSGGVPRNIGLYWHSKDNLDRLVTIFKLYVKRNWKIIILSRADISSLREFLKTCPLNPYIHDVYGSCSDVNEEHFFLGKMLTKSEKYLMFPDERVDEQSNELWTGIKSMMLEKIAEHFHLRFDKVYFADDTKANVDKANQTGFKNSFLCANTSIGLADVLLNQIPLNVKAVYDMSIFNLTRGEAEALISKLPPKTGFFRISSAEPAQLAKNTKLKRVFAISYFDACSQTMKHVLINEEIISDENGILESHFSVLLDTLLDKSKTCNTCSFSTLSEFGPMFNISIISEKH